jgi:hypothetical protein
LHGKARGEQVSRTFKVRLTYSPHPSQTPAIAGVTAGSIRLAGDGAA